MRTAKGMTVADYNSFKRSDKQADSKVASDFYHHWKEDIDLMKEMGMKAYRFSLSWARIIPDGDGEVNQKGIDFYNNVINYLLKQGHPAPRNLIPFRSALRSGREVQWLGVQRLCLRF